MKAEGSWSVAADLVCTRERVRTVGPWGCCALQCRVLHTMAEQLALPPDFELLPWEFASAISWNMNVFIFKGEQT